MTALADDIGHIIASEGPISLERYMGLALTHPTKGYYTTRDPFGAAGDFVTAPEISQMFGELIGLWACEIWALVRRASSRASGRTGTWTRHLDGRRSAGR